MIFLMIFLTLLFISPAHADYYVVNSKGKVIARSTYLPNANDLNTRGEFFIKSSSNIDLAQADYVGGNIVEHQKTSDELSVEASKTKAIKEDMLLHLRMEKIAYEQLKEEGVKFDVVKDSDYEGK